LLDTMPRAYELLVAPLGTAEKDGYCAEARTGARLLGVPDDLVPITYEEVGTALVARLGDGSLVVTDTARALARDILMPRTPVPWPAGRIHRLVTVGLLPPVLRDAFGLEWSRRDEASLLSWSAGIRRLSPFVPRSVRRWRAARG
jgi:uncharacterized protein (DUF2236 family)